ncbi:DUF6951 family protein [Zhaonella formicivorans]|jgi:hypothetical protein|uniref:DUF6951 family protein n=1 Tax=Zhaonella formicivorans TaxID=2528593 RepID=UPI0010DE96EC|nr:hypothetical protein [Zhaonella formicivorans]
MVKAEIDAGVCGFKTEVNASGDMMKVNLEINSGCPNIQKLAEELKELEAMKEVFAKIGSTKVYELASKYCPHPGCPVPAGIIKAVEVSAGFALPKNAEIKISKE